MFGTVSNLRVVEYDPNENPSLLTVVAMDEHLHKDLEQSFQIKFVLKKKSDDEIRDMTELEKKFVELIKIKNSDDHSERGDWAIPVRREYKDFVEKPRYVC